MTGPRSDADVCLVLEGAYPFVAGGVSSWTHDLIRAHAHLRFHIVALAANETPQILGRADEDTPLGPGGFVVPVANPLATAKALAELIGDRALRARCGEAMRRRTETYYNKRVVDRLDRGLYKSLLDLRDVPRIGRLEAA